MQIKNCPYCKEEIHIEAVKCKHCHSMLDNVSASVNTKQSSTNSAKHQHNDGWQCPSCNTTNDNATLRCTCGYEYDETACNEVKSQPEAKAYDESSQSIKPSSQNQSAETGYKFSIVDAKLIFTQFLYIGLASAVMYFFTSGSKLNLIPLFLIIFFVLKIRANWSGCVCDPSDNTLSFPGGGKQAKNFIEYLSPIFWLQGIKRYSVNIDQIMTIEMDYSESILSSMSDKSKPFYNYYLVLLGSFGSYKIGFESETKRDELYAVIRNINQMGIPYIRAEGSGSVI
ncbi:MAG: hypothetical protein HIU83_13370 [Proteobacteria bacterium]|nr:hypothetical protein [Pseudomonadota bacterium]